MTAWRTFDVTVHGFPAIPYSAPTRGKAIAAAFRDYGVLDDRITFGGFMKIARARVRKESPTPDGYDYVRRAYGVSPCIGQRCRLRDEGPSTGLEGEVVYPGRSTVHVHVVIDGRDYAVMVHPTNVELLS